MKALIDGDVLVYRAGFAAQKTEYAWLPHEGERYTCYSPKKEKILEYIKNRKFTKKDGALKKVTYVEPVGWACHSIKLMIFSILEELKTDEYTVFLSSTDKSNFRFDIAKTKPYKGNRKQPKPVHYSALRDYLINFHNAQIIFHEEADDALGYTQTDDTVICTIDKDLDMIPGKHYNFVTGESCETKDPGHLELSGNRRKLTGGGYKWFYAQMLLGDNADNIPGLAGYGPVMVYNLLHPLDNEESCAKLIYREYQKQGVEDRFLEVADLLWIRRVPGEIKSLALQKLIT